MVCDVLRTARSPLHVSDILARIQQSFGFAVDRESLVSSLTKKVARGDRFVSHRRQYLRAPAGGR